MDATKATGSRDTLAMLLYSRLFDWYNDVIRVDVTMTHCDVIIRLVSKINQSLGRSEEGISFISILDIYVRRNVFF
jgi:myosin heavy subunit